MGTNITGNRFLLISLLILSVFLTDQNILFAGDKPTSKNIKFKLFPSNYFTTYNVSADLTGSDNQGNSYTGTLQEKTFSKTKYLGKSAIPVKTVMGFVMSSGYGTASLENYYSAKGKNIHFLGVSGDIETVSAKTFAIPDTAKIGRSGKIGTYTDKRNFKTNLSWQLEDGFNGKAKFIILNKTTKPSGVLDNTFKTTYLIQKNGKRDAVELETYNDTVKIRMTLKGTYKKQ